MKFKEKHTGANETDLYTTISRKNSLTKNMKILGDNGIKVIRKIGSGNFGEIWLGLSLTNGTKYAIKYERARLINSPLNIEYRMYKILGKSAFLPIIYYFSQIGRYNTLVMELLGPNLEELFKHNACKFSLKAILMISMQTIKIFEFIHNHGIIYRDVKPQNFVVGINPGSEHRVHIVDFGLSREYIIPATRVHIPYCEGRNLTGTARYMSINTHLGREQSRRDDLESLGYMYFYFLRGTLPWQGLKVEEGQDHYQKIGRVKHQTTISALCKNSPDVFASYLCYCRNLDFYETPDYNYLYGLFSNFYEHNEYREMIFDFQMIRNLSVSDESSLGICGNDAIEIQHKQREKSNAPKISDPSLVANCTTHYTINERHPPRFINEELCRTVKNNWQNYNFKRSSFFSRFKALVKNFFQNAFCCAKNGAHADRSISIYPETNIPP